MKQAVVITVVAIAFLPGCTSGHSGSTPTPRSRGTPEAPPVASAAALRKAVRAAIEEDHRMSVRVLWTNRVPRHPTATAGPALANLRKSVAQRRRHHIRVRLVSERFRILTLKLDPSYAAATATVLAIQRSQPTGINGKPLGKPVRLKERAHLTLRRLGSSRRFVVWEVAAA